jgi:transposase
LVPFEQVARCEKAAHSVTTKIDDRTSSGAEHCQEKAQTFRRADFCHWMLEKFQ